MSSCLPRGWLDNGHGHAVSYHMPPELSLTPWKSTGAPRPCQQKQLHGPDNAAIGQMEHSGALLCMHSLDHALFTRQLLLDSSAPCA
jgi:hypothetical protein